MASRAEGSIIMSLVGWLVAGGLVPGRSYDDVGTYGCAEIIECGTLVFGNRVDGIESDLDWILT